ncbi:MAG: FG-GAP-like repeat-containing protein [Desulfobacterales bacterium]|jgi:protein involved in polysaccharide export with SLBB domain
MFRAPKASAKTVPVSFNLALALLATLLVSIFAGGCTQTKSLEATAETHPVISPESRPVSSGNFRTVALADLDNDGSLDLVAGGSSPPGVIISYGDGRGGMSQPQNLYLKGEIQSAAVADVNEDGLKDVIVSVQRGASGVKVWLNRTSRQWTLVKGPIEINDYQGLATADIDGDGHIDLIAANASSDTQGGIQVWLGDGNSNWPKETGPTITGRYMDIALADFNEDGILDLVGAGWGIYGSLNVWIGDGSGNWSSVPPLNKGSYYGLSVADIDGDRHMDILAASYRNGVHVFLGDGSATFVKSKSPQEDGSFWDIAAIDLNGDDTLDLLASSLDAAGIKSWQNQGADQWEPIRGRFPLAGSFYDLAIADVNQDGHDDVCAASLGEGIKFWRGSGERGVGFLSKEERRISGPEAYRNITIPQENSVFTNIFGFPEYKVDPGDILEITLWQGIEAIKEEVVIRPDGKISFGFVEDLYVKGLTPTQLDDLLTRYIREYVIQPRIDVIVKEYNSKFVTISGAIQGGVRTGPGTAGAGEYRLSGKMSLLELVSKAGGPTPDANLRNVRLRRKSGQAISLDLNKAIFQGDASQDIILDAGDLVFIPTLSAEANRVYVFGEVKDPGLYTFTESEIRIFDVISKAGGPTVFATAESSKIVRGDVTQPEIISVDLKRLIEQGDQTQNVILASGDLVYVPRRFWGDLNVFWQRIKPLFELIISPARIVNEYDDALDALGGD